MTLQEKNILIYETAREYLNEILPEGMTPVDLEKYYVGDRKDYSSLTDIYEQLIFSAQNYQAMPNYIKYETRRDTIKQILNGFDLEQIAQKSVEDLCQEFHEAFAVDRQISKYDSWHKWSHSVIDAAKFMLNFKSVNDFKAFVAQFDYNLPMRTALPLLISHKISGMGFTLACDTLKELGFTNYAKPDIHLIDICSELSLTDREPLSVFEAIAQMSYDCEEIDPDVTPYKVDKILWLICSGKFYLDDITIKRHKDDFIQKAKAKIEENRES